MGTDWNTWAVDSTLFVFVQLSGHVKPWNRLKKDGILEDELIDHMWREFLPKKQPLLDLMDKFDLLCERIDQVFTDFCQ